MRAVHFLTLMILLANSGITDDGQSHMADTSASKQIAGWGDIVNPMRNATIQLDDDVLTMTAPDIVVDNNPSLLMNAPRVSRSLDGAFTINVTVQHVDLVEPFSVHPDLGDLPTAIHAGSLILRADDASLVLFSRVNRNENGKPETVCELQMWREDERIVKSTLPAKDLPTTLRLRIFGPELRASFSQDNGKNWKHFRKRSLEHLPPELDVGLTMTSNTESGSMVKFRSLKFETTE